MGKLAILALALALAGCGGGGVDLTGMYTVTSHTANTASCTAEGPAVTDPPYFRFVKDEFFGQEYFGLSLCTDATDASCTGSAGLFLFAEEIDDGYRAQFSSSSGGGTFECSLGYGEATAVQSDTGVRVEMRSYGEAVPGLSEDACSTDEAESRGDAMPCENFEVLVGTLLEPA